MAEKTTLLGPSALLGVSWEAYKKRWKTLIGIQLVTTGIILGGLAVVTVPAAIFFALFKGMYQATPFVSFVLVVYIILAMLFLMLLISWGQLALILAIVKNDLTMKVSFQEARKLSVWSYVWLGLLNAGVVMGGIVLLIIPGILFGIWTTFAKYIFVEERKQGMSVLLASREYFRDRFWPVLGRIAVIGLLSMMLQGSVSSIPFLGMIVSFAFAPFSALYTYFLYKDLVRLHKDRNDVSNADTRNVFLAAGWLSVALLALMFLLPLILTLTKGN